MGAIRWLAAGTLLVAAPIASAEPFSHAGLDTILARHLRDGQVDYAGLANDRGPLDRYLAATLTAHPEQWPRAQQIAFWVNVYNARVLAGVIAHPGLRSVLDVGKTFGVPTLGFFREQAVTAGRQLSLNDIEHRIVRARFHEPRVHFVLNCASASCPVLPSRALSGATLDSTLEAATLSFLSDPRRNRIDPARGLWLSSIFKWYRADFESSAGSLQTFIERHWSGHEVFGRNLPVRFLDYDWSLNGNW